MSDAPLVIDLMAIAKPYPKQAQFLNSPGYFSTFLAGVGSGKTHALAWKAILRMLRNPNVDGAVLGRTGNDIATVILPKIWEHLDALQEATGVNWLKDYNKGLGRIELINGGGCWLRPYNRIQKVRGLNLGWAMADETEWSEADPDEVFSVFLARVRVPCPWPGVDFCTSPNGLRGITRKFYDAQLRGDSRYHVTTARTYDIPFLPETFLESLRGSMGQRRYEQEVEGKILRPQSSVFDIKEHHVIIWKWEEHRDLPWVMGWDIGTDKHHVALMCQVREDGTWVVADELISDEVPRGKFRRLIQQWIRSKGKDPYLMAGDRAIPTELGWFTGAYPHVHVRKMDTKHEQYRGTGIEMLRDALDPAGGVPKILFSNSLRVAWPEKGSAGILTAMRALQYKKDFEGNPTTYVLKDNVNDHATDALRYAWVGSRKYPELHGGVTLSMAGLGPPGDGEQSGNNHAHW